MTEPAATPDFGSRTDFYTFAPETLARELPDFEIVREVGKGSMGIVYEAVRRADGQRVALKVLPPSLTLTEQALARFLREGELMSKVRHPGIVSALEHGRQGRLHYFVMEFVDGVTADERLRVGPLPIQKAAEIACQVARALQVAHEHGVVHRDVKPSNLMIRQDERVAITDFGLARETGTGSMTESGSIVGTPMYMAPEQVLGERDVVGTRADVYGLGATLYHLVTGVPPFSGPTAQSVLKAVLERDPVPPRRLRSELPPALETIILVAMDKEPGRRYGSAQDLAEDLARFIRGERILSRRPRFSVRGYRAAAKRPLATLLTAVVIALAVVAFAMNHERQIEQLQLRVQEAESKIAQASALPDQLRTMSTEKRHAHLLDAVEIASEAIAEDPDFAPAWFARAQAQHRLQEYHAALRDLDEAERRRGRPTPEILYFRIDTLGNLPGSGASQRLRDDLTTLLNLEPGPYTQSLVAEHLLDMASEAQGQARFEILAHADTVLANVRAQSARAALGRARLLELRGDLAQAEIAMSEARVRFRGDPLVHYHASQMFRRLGNHKESRHEARLARILDPLSWPENSDPASCPASQDRAPVDMDEVHGFLSALMGVLEPGKRERP